MRFRRSLPRPGLKLLVLLGTLVGFCVVAAVLTADSRLASPLAALMVAGVLAIASSLATAVYIESRLDRVGRTVQEIGRGSLDFQLPRFALREIDNLAGTINEMANELQTSHRGLLERAYYDPLTRLPNRALFMSRLGTALSRSRSGNRIAVLFVDLDHFKRINDSLGHEVGDRLLVEASRRLQAAANADCILARLGGDEFVVLVDTEEVTTAVLELGDRIMRLMDQPVSLNGRDLFVSASVGVAVCRDPKLVPSELMRQADIALYQAKAEGRSRCVAYDASREQVTAEHVELQSQLHRAIDRDELVVYYQPEIDLATGAIVGMEALIRWDHPHHGVLSPGDFLAMAEESGEILRIGEWVLQRACEDTAQMIARGLGSLVVSVNVSAREFRDPELLDRIPKTLASSGLSANNLKIEVTESTLMVDLPNTADILNRFRSLGIGIAIDDFGTGYSSLAYLRELPFNTLKIDRSFVSMIGHDEKTRGIIDAVIRMSKALGMTVVAEGIEEGYQINLLENMGCDRGQGYYYSPPVTIDEIVKQISLSAWKMSRSEDSAA